MVLLLRRNSIANVTQAKNLQKEMFHVLEQLNSNVFSWEGKNWLNLGQGVLGRLRNIMIMLCLNSD